MAHKKRDINDEVIYDYINDTLHRSTATIEQMARDKAKKEGWIFERHQGNNRLLAALVNGAWDEGDFLVVPPEHTIRQDYRDERLIKAVKNDQ